MDAWIYATEAEARRAIAAIDGALGSTEVVRLPDGRAETRPRKTWAHPVPLRDGTWAVPYKPRLASVTDRTVRVDGTNERVKRADETIAIASDDREDTREEGK